MKSYIGKECKMNLIVGLGNPGGEYKDTRHNVGFMVVEKIAKEIGGESARWDENDTVKSSIIKIGDVLLAKPVTFMNNSGIAVSKILNFYKLSVSDLWVIHDDIDLPLGKIRIRTGGGSAGHNGVESIMHEVKSDKFTRFRMGIGRGKLFGKVSADREEDERIKKENRVNADKRMYHRSIVDFVLSKFSLGEAGSLKHLINNGSDAVLLAREKGIEKAMEQFN